MSHKSIKESLKKKKTRFIASYCTRKDVTDCPLRLHISINKQLFTVNTIWFGSFSILQERTSQCWYGHSVRSLSLVQFSVFHIKTFSWFCITKHQTKKRLKKLVRVFKRLRKTSQSLGFVKIFLHDQVATVENNDFVGWVSIFLCDPWCITTHYCERQFQCYSETETKTKSVHEYIHPYSWVTSRSEAFSWRTCWWRWPSGGSSRRPCSWRRVAWWATPGRRSRSR